MSVSAFSVVDRANSLPRADRTISDHDSLAGSSQDGDVAEKRPRPGFPMRRTTLVRQRVALAMALLSQCSSTRRFKVRVLPGAVPLDVPLDTLLKPVVRSDDRHDLIDRSVSGGDRFGRTKSTIRPPGIGATHDQRRP